MRYKSYNNYDIYPKIKIDNDKTKVFDNEKLKSRIKESIKYGKRLFVFDMYMGVSKKDVLNLLLEIDNAVIIDTDLAKKEEEELHKQFDLNITDDRVFGKMCLANMCDCFDVAKKSAIELKTSKETENPVFLIGSAAGLFIKNPDEHWFFDITRWEIQLRYRRGGTNWLFNNPEAPQLTKYKIGFFLEWRFEDRYKKEVLKDVDIFVDSNVEGELKGIESKTFFEVLEKTSKQPFHMQAYFDPSVWGGQWMKNTFGLKDNGTNYGWSFDGVPEENSLRFDFGGESVEFPCMDLIKTYPENLLGKKVYGRFGAEFPIRFDLLDTFEGGNLSLQCHPLTEFIQERFGMNYTQDESYYILDALEGSSVYLGVKENADKNEIEKELKSAERGEKEFDAEKFVNKIPVKKHDHVLIPGGTVHCSGKNTMVLEISATPYIFTFKMWDWGRIGLDGLPRPVHIDNAMKNIQFNRDTKWVNDNLIHMEKIISQDDGVTVERTGLHEYEFIETKRYTISDKVIVESNDSVTVINLVDGEKAYIESISSEFATQEIHYAETFIIPASVNEFILKTENKKSVKIVAASVRG